MATKICRVTNDGSGDVREDGLPMPKTRYIYPDPSGIPTEAWLWDVPRAYTPTPFQPPVDPKDMTDSQIAADPLFPLVARVVKERRKSGPTSKRPTGLTVDDRGFCYWHITGKWFDATGTALT